MTKTHSQNVVVIVGGGIIGLSTAYNLAKRHGTDIKIKIVEAFEKTFAAASSTCTGCIHYGFTGDLERLIGLGKYSFDLWAEEAKNSTASGSEFMQLTGYRPRSCFGIEPEGTGQGLDLLPDWVERSSSWNVDDQVLGANTAMVNPIGTGEWITKQCLDLGVEIQTGVQVVDITLSPENQVQAVTCVKKGNGGESCPSLTRIKCKQVVLACGPWTPTIYQTLFPSSPIHLQWNTDAGDWAEWENPCPTTQLTTAFVSFAHIIGEKLEFAARNNGTIWACGRRNLTALLPPTGQMDKPDPSLIQELNGRALEWINWGCRCKETTHRQLQVLNSGRAFRPASKTSLPIISEVPSPDLTGGGCSNDGSNQENQARKKSPSGVFVCWGHGSYGLTLGMGSGKLMSQLMSREKTDIDLSLFTLGDSQSLSISTR
ncbi:FAD dependent oxidoreductase superfamily [Naviculisporaceae sp. PSN 640]